MLYLKLFYLKKDTLFVHILLKRYIVTMTQLNQDIKYSTTIIL